MRNILKVFKKTSGFTLVELLVVIAILGVLATVLLAAIDPLEQISKGNDKKVQADVVATYTAAANYAAENPAVGFPAAIGTATIKINPVSPYGGAYTYAITTAAGVNDQAVVCGVVKSKGLRGALATAQFIATGRGNCVILGTTACTVAAAVCP